MTEVKVHWVPLTDSMVQRGVFAFTLDGQLWCHLGLLTETVRITGVEDPSSWVVRSIETLDEFGVVLFEAVDALERKYLADLERLAFVSSCIESGEVSTPLASGVL